MASPYSHQPGVSPAPFWGSLAPGPYAVGFDSRWEFDLARRYAWPGAAADSQGLPSYRPILFHTWYPTAQAPAGTPMLHQDYLGLEPPGPGFEQFVSRLVEFNLDVISDEVMGKARAELDDREQSEFEQVLGSPTAAFRNAVPEEGRYPLIVYHGGLGSAFEDNSVLCEFLCSHGYVVVNSAYQSESASWFNVDWDLERSMKDLDLLVNAMRRRTNVDPDRLAAMGHSFGGQAALAYRAEPNSPVDAVVSLDATIEYLAHEEWAKRRPRFAEKLSQIERMTAPMLIFTARAASPRFDVYEAMTFAERYLAQVAHLKHNDFISHGAISADLRLLRDKDDSQAAAARHCYDLVCRSVLRFFDAYLKGNPGAMEELRRGSADAGADPAPISIEYRQAASLPTAPA